LRKDEVSYRMPFMESGRDSVKDAQTINPTERGKEAQKRGELKKGREKLRAAKTENLQHRHKNLGGKTFIRRKV